MKATICKVNERNIQDVNKCDGVFTINSKLCLEAENDVIRYTVVSIPGRQKRYAPEEINYGSYLTNPDKTIFLAYVDGQLAGQIILRKNWNHYAYIEDIAVDVHFRNGGIGRALMNEAIQWSKAGQLPGIMLETQNNNVQACHFYEHCGFKLGGFDTNLYKGINENTEEIALYWYLIF